MIKDSQGSSSQHIKLDIKIHIHAFNSRDIYLMYHTSLNRSASYISINYIY